jgi:hypothetical protein
MNARVFLTCALVLVLGFGAAQADDLYVPTGYATIQAAIDAAATSGDVIHVAAGTYQEQLKIDGKSLDLVGAGIGSAIIEAVDMGSRTTYSITQWNGSTKTIDPCVGVVGPGTVNISGFTVDGRSLGGSDFYGIHFFDAGGSVTECRIEDILHASSPGAQSVVSVVATHSATVASYAIELSDNVVPNFQKGGLVVMGPYWVCTVEDNLITNAPSPYNAGNGIQLSYGASGTTARNEVSGVGYTGDDWAATGILLFESGDVSMTDDAVHDCQMGVSFSDWHWIYTNTSPVNIALDGLELYENSWGFVGHLAGDDCDLNLTATDCFIHDNTGDGFDVYGDGIDPWGGGYYTGWDNGDLDVEMTDCSILNTTGYDGIWTADYSGNANNVDFTVDGTAFSGNNEAAIWNGFTQTIVAENCYWGDPAGPTVIPPLRGPADVRTAAPSVSPFGDDLPAVGYVHTTESAMGRAGDGVYGPVDYDPFLIGNIVCDPDPEYLTAADPDKTIDVKYLGGGSAGLYGYQIKFSWDGGIASTAAAHVDEGPLLSDLGGTFFWAQNSGTNEVTVDCALLGDIDGATGPGTMFTVDFTAVALGTSPVTITILNVRDRNNVPLTGITADHGQLVVDISVPTITGVEILNQTLSHTNDYIKDTDAAKVRAYVLDDDPTFAATDIWANLDGLTGGSPVTPDTYDPISGLAEWTTTIGSVTCDPQNGTAWVYVDATDPIGNTATQGSDDITSDNIAPTKILNFDAAPGHNEADLSWDDPTLTDDNFYQVEIQSNAWTDYPTYDVLLTPSYPADQDDGTDVWEGTGNSHTATYAGDGSERDIYYYQAFASDWVLHFGPADATARDRCTNYWLGDVVTDASWGTYDGYVGDFDIDKLGGTYFVSGLAWPDNQCDVGPTFDASRLGIPIPDDFVGFEDLMIFAMNYGVVAPKPIPFFGEQEIWPALALELEERSVGSEIEIAVNLKGNVDEVKGLSAVVEYDPSELEFMNARLSSDMSSPMAPVFSWFEPLDSSVQVDLAVLGTDVTIGGSGDVAYLTFRALGDEYAVDFGSAVMRGAANEPLDAEFEGIASKPDLPTVFRLVGNSPNPFNPLTKIAYHVPYESDVSVRIYDVAGREVRVLVDDVIEPGRYQAVWNGRDEAGEAVGSGVYFCVMETPDYHGSRKMLLLK